MVIVWSMPAQMTPYSSASSSWRQQSAASGVDSGAASAAGMAPEPASTTRMLTNTVLIEGSFWSGRPRQGN